MLFIGHLLSSSALIQIGVGMLLIQALSNIMWTWAPRKMMMVEDLGVEAKEAAVREVAKLLPLSELLLSIASINAGYIFLPKSSAFVIRLCQECQTLIEN